MIAFNAILRDEGVDPSTVLLVRHKDSHAMTGRSPYALWRSEPAALELYQSIQSKARFVIGAFVATFVVSPAGDTIFVGLYAVRGIGTAPNGMIDPVSGKDVSGVHLYDLALDSRLAAYRGLLIIDWGKGYIAWIQKAAGNNKLVLEVRRLISDPPFPGFTEFRYDIEIIETIPETWKQVLRSVKGVYVLVCRETGKLYIGSAKGEESLWGRFSEYAANGHGGNLELKARGPKSYQVSVLEIANSGYGIELLEEAWKRKLMSRELGLNSPVLAASPSSIRRFAVAFAGEAFEFGRWVAGNTEKGEMTMPWVELSDTALAFVEAAHNGGWVLESFAWAGWKDSKEAKRLRDIPGAVEKASVRQIAQLFTLLIRADRFSEGTLLNAFQTGLLTRIVTRAAALT